MQTEAAKHTALYSMRRIASDTEQIRILTGAGLADRPMGKALKNPHELIRVLTQRLADFR